MNCDRHKYRISNKNIKLMMCRLQNGDINYRIQVIEQNGKDIPFISIDSLWGLLPILNRYIEKNRYIEIFYIEVDDTIRYIDIETIC